MFTFGNAPIAFVMVATPHAIGASTLEISAAARARGIFADGISAVARGIGPIAVAVGIVTHAIVAIADDHAAIPSAIGLVPSAIAAITRAIAAAWTDDRRFSQGIGVFLRTWGGAGVGGRARAG